MKSLTTKPGTFRAFCKQGEWKAAADCTAEQLAAAGDGTVQSRWDHELRCEVLAIVCDQTFGDAAAFEQHMLEQHGRKAATWGPSKGEHENWSRTINAGWPKLRLPKDGKDLAKAAAQQLETCPTCELRAQVDTLASEQWWRDHVRGCALAQSGVAS